MYKIYNWGPTESNKPFKYLKIFIWSTLKNIYTCINIRIEKCVYIICIQK